MAEKTATTTPRGASPNSTLRDASLKLRVDSEPELKGVESVVVENGTNTSQDETEYVTGARLYLIVLGKRLP